MDRRQLTITIGAVVLALVLGAGVALLASSGSDDSGVTTGTAPPTLPTTLDVEHDRRLDLDHHAPADRHRADPAAGHHRHHPRGHDDDPRAAPAAHVDHDHLDDDHFDDDDLDDDDHGRPHHDHDQPATDVGPRDLDHGAEHDEHLGHQHHHPGVHGDRCQRATHPSRRDRRRRRRPRRCARLGRRREPAWRHSRDARCGSTSCRPTAPPTGYAAAVATACGRDLAIVASLTALDTDTEALDCGIPNIAIETAVGAGRGARHDVCRVPPPHRDRRGRPLPLPPERARGMLLAVRARPRPRARACRDRSRHRSRIRDRLRHRRHTRRRVRRARDRVRRARAGARCGERDVRVERPRSRLDDRARGMPRIAPA